MYKNKTGVFSPYITQPPTNSCRPLIAVKPLTKAEKDNLKALYNSIKNGTAQDLPVCKS